MRQRLQLSAAADGGRRVVVLRFAGLAMRWRLRTLLVGAVLALALGSVSIWSLTLGTYPLTVTQVLQALVDDPEAGFARTVVVDWRLPRALAAVIFGAALGVAGAVFQSLTRNPLASPDIIGFSAGSYTGALVVILIAGGSYGQVAGGALAGGILTAAVVYLLAWRNGVQGFRLIIVGISVAATLGSLNTWLMLRADLDTAMSAAAWGAGSLGSVGWSQATIGGWAVLASLMLILWMGPDLRQLELGDDAARASGVRTEPLRLAAVAIAVVLTATVTAAAGPISFVALAAPQIVIRLTRQPGFAVIPAALCGALLLATADLTAQHLLPVSLPVGVVTVVLGGAYLVWLVVAEVRRRR